MKRKIKSVKAARLIAKHMEMRWMNMATEETPSRGSEGYQPCDSHHNPLNPGDLVVGLWDSVGFLTGVLDKAMGFTIGDTRFDVESSKEIYKREE